MELSFEERFDGPGLDEDVWVPHYLAHWSSRAESKATWDLVTDGLRLSIPEDQGLWCADLHDEPLRVSCLQSASFSGPAGGAIGPQPFREGLLVREAQPTLWGYTPLYGHVEVRMRAVVSPSSMYAFWMAGIEDRPERSGEICVAEVFGDTVGEQGVRLGVGVHQFRDPGLREEFSTVPCAIDPVGFHVYAVDWDPGELAFSVDGVEVLHLLQSPDYPMQLMIGLFEFPERRPADAPLHEPELVISHVKGWQRR